MRLALRPLSRPIAAVLPAATLLAATLLAATLLGGCVQAPLRPAPISATEPSANRLVQDSHKASASYAGPARPLPWVPLEPTPGLANPAPEPFTGFNGTGLNAPAFGGSGYNGPSFNAPAFGGSGFGRRGY